MPARGARTRYPLRSPQRLGRPWPKSGDWSAVVMDPSWADSKEGKGLRRSEVLLGLPRRGGDRLFRGSSRLGAGAPNRGFYSLQSGNKTGSLVSAKSFL
jgi:hypothetical protein